MNFNSKYILYIAFLWMFIASCLTANAQQETMLYFMKDMPQSSQLNPAHRSVYKTSIILPSAYVNAESTTFYYNSIFSDDEYGSNVDLEKLFENLKDNNVLETSAYLDIFGLYITSDKVSISLFIREKLSALSSINEDVGELFSKGTAHQDNLNKTFNVAPTINLSHYREYGIGFNYNIKDQWTFGLNIKYLSGIMNVQATDATIEITTEDAVNYPLHVKVDGPIQTAGLPNILDKAGNFSTANIGDYLAGGAGNGYAVDVGLTYQFSDKLLFEFAATNIGQIFWTNGRRNYEIGAQDYNSYTIVGASPQQIINQEIDNTQYDSLVALFDYQLTEDGNLDSYTTYLPTYVNLASSYDFGHKFIIGATLGFSYYDSYFNPRVSVSMNKRFADFLGIGLNYTADKSGISRLGAAVSVGFPGIKVYAVSDDIVYNISNWQNSQSLGIRVGVNLNFGYVKKNYINKKETRASQLMDPD
ncbi:hypothetical protein EI427_09170 [Flammeovirga pectinis]|uniref:DUF5723 domain-containing protein n=1 Tax=Flammeovirga pectinis TaxID=2494373 RepID=A0A3Q9FNM6_9BACT|nr:DUF5723 family protein [Flammeovirga pectinis]AZQ62400.1 hypothetical protein EI427_09170 [Flammeovirga pectinis]